MPALRNIEATSVSLSIKGRGPVASTCYDSEILHRRESNPFLSRRGEFRAEIFRRYLRRRLKSSCTSSSSAPARIPSRRASKPRRKARGYTPARHGRAEQKSFRRADAGEFGGTATDCE